MLKRIHKYHSGIGESKMRTRQIFYRQKLSPESRYIKNCQLQQKSNQKETVMNHSISQRPWK